MINNTKKLVICVVLYLPLVQCQRPSYAGSRPPNGHKDKYRPTQSPAAIELANRFSENALENGATQRPPQGVHVVNAEPAFIPITTNQVQTPTTGNINKVGVSTQNSSDVVNRSGITGSTQESPTNSANSNRLPLDAHGDQQLIDHLSRLPIDNQPFWFINYQAIEAHRNNSVNTFGPIASRSSFLGK